MKNAVGGSEGLACGMCTVWDEVSRNKEGKGEMSHGGMLISLKCDTNNTETGSTICKTDPGFTTPPTPETRQGYPS